METLPSEVVKSVLLLSEFKELFLSFSFVSKKWYTLIQSSSSEIVARDLPIAYERYLENSIPVSTNLLRHIFELNQKLKFNLNTSGIQYADKGTYVHCKMYYHSNVVTADPVPPSQYYWEYLIRRKNKSDARMWLGVTFNKNSYKDCVCNIVRYPSIGWYVSQGKIESQLLTKPDEPHPEEEEKEEEEDVHSDSDIPATYHNTPKLQFHSTILLPDSIPKPGTEDYVGLLVNNAPCNPTPTISFYLNNTFIQSVPMPSQHYYPMVELHGGDLLKLITWNRDVASSFRDPFSEKDES